MDAIAVVFWGFAAVGAVFLAIMIWSWRRSRKSLLNHLEGAELEEVSHTAELDSLRIRFKNNAVLIVYNDASIGTLSLSINDPSVSLPQFCGLCVEAISSSATELILHLSAGSRVRVGLNESAIQGPEAFQLILPGYPLIVEQNS